MIEKIKTIDDSNLSGERAKRLEKILDVAQTLFVEKGLAESSMSEIAEMAKISRRTLYRYYASKEDLAFAVETRVFTTFYRDLKEYLQTISGSGYEMLQNLFRSLPLYIEKHGGEVKFTGVFDHYFSGDYPASEESEKFVRAIQEDGNPIAVLLHRGQNDGSIRKDIDAVLTARTMGNCLISMAQRMIIRGHHIEKEQNSSPAEMLRHFVEMLLDSVRPEK